MESTSFYWRTVYEVFEDFDVIAIVVNAYHSKNVPGRKTDVKDSEWLSELGLYGLLKASFIPSRDFRDLRMLTRYRTKLVGMLAGEKNRLIKILDSCGIKLASVVSSINGVSATRIINALIDGHKLTPDDIVKMLEGNLRKKYADVVLAVDGRLSDRNRYLL